MYSSFRVMGILLLGWSLVAGSTAAQDDNPFHEPDPSADPFQNSATDQPPAVNLQVKSTAAMEAAVEAMDLDAKLEQYVACEILDTEFDDLRKVIQEQLGISIFVHPNSPMSGNTRINFQCDGSITFEKSLETLLEQHDSDFVVDGNLIKVISRDEIFEMSFLSQKIVDARPLIETFTDERMEQYSNDREPPHRWEIRMIVEEELVDLIKNSLAEDSWDHSGSIIPLNGLFVISNARSVLNQAEALIREMKAKMGTSSQ